MRSAFSNFKKQFKIRHFINYMVIAGLILVLIVMNAFGILGRGDRSTLVRIAYSMILAVSLNLVVGFLGELSLGHAAFMCVGAYLGGFFSNLLAPALGNGILPMIICMLFGGAIAALFGLIIGIPALRLKGDYLAITTLAFGEIVRNLFKNIPLFGAAKGLNTATYDQNTLFIVSLVTLFIVLLLVQNLIRSKHGRAITAIRDNEIAAKAMGVNVTFYKLFIFVLSAFFAGIAGVLYAKCFGTVRQETFSYNYSIEILVMVVLGGIGSVNGSMIAAAIITFVNIKLQDSLSGALAPLKLIVYAIILIVIILFNNAPAFAKVKALISPKEIIRRFSKKQKGPEVVRADEADWSRIPTKIKMDEILSVDPIVRDGEPVAPDKPKKGGK